VPLPGYYVSAYAFVPGGCWGFGAARGVRTGPARGAAASGKQRRPGGAGAVGALVASGGAYFRLERSAASISSMSFWPDTGLSRNLWIGSIASGVVSSGLLSS
jgi:hypothetical protein